MYCARDLLLGETNNIAEHYNSIVAKFVGGKRVNFALSNSYLYKAHAAAVQFNTKKAVTTLYQTVFQRDPPTLTQKIESKRLQKALREKNRRAENKANHIRPVRFNDTKQNGSGYGENCERPDLSAEDFENEKEIFLTKLKQNHENRIYVEEQTRTKERNTLWKTITINVLMASNFGSVCKSKVMAKQVEHICKKMISQDKATKHKNESLPTAKKQLEKEQEIAIRDCGVFIDQENMCLAASPSGITIDDEIIIEIHCPKNISSKDPNNDDTLQLPSAQYDFIKLQIKNSGKKKKGYRFTFDEKSLALVVYKQNPKRYKDLLRITNLPTRRTLIKHAAALHFKEGINRKLMDFIKTEVSQMNEIDRFCTIVWDEMSLSTHLDFYPIKDYIDGFEDLESKRSTDFATHALVFMVRGMNKAYKQPISYFLTNTICAAELAELIQLVISVVIDAGLKVVGSVCDAVNSNMAAVKRLINPKCVRGIMLGKLLEYTVRDATICHYFDPPHLIKSVRNNMMVKNLNHTVSFNEAKFRPNGVLAWNKKNKQHRSASWSDLRDFYRFNNTGAFFNLIPKITDEHLYPTRHKMKVKIATQVFSGTVGRNMYLCWKRNVFKNNCIGTAAILLFFNELFDSVNGGDVPDPETLTGALTVKSKHFDFWDYAIRMLESMKFSDNLKTGKPNRSNVFKHFTSTLKGIRRISERLFEAGIQSISLRRWNQDGLENHFGIIRSLCGSNTKPNARDFRSAYSTSIINNLLTDNSLNANCEPDDDKPMLQNLQILFNSQQLTVEKLGEEESADSATGKQKFMAIVKMLNEKERMSHTNFLEAEAQNCISAKICETLLVKMKCKDCATTVIHHTKDKRIEHDIIRKQSSVGEIILPKVEFIDCIKAWICKVLMILPHLCAEKNLSSLLIAGNF
ncbi:DNA transposase THAP9 [Pseudolycoriella hygida]|uniref:DNA transposase THAP9 n=1 Tax=Pseudolycoriella hygida TaxID=35572 RepID=A0A9Q0N3R4_9DIPT|nr:DNA transposase THAP9 [Pseudolycoriella hygida]